MYVASLVLLAPQEGFKNGICNMLGSIMKTEGDSVEVPIPLQKIANIVTQLFNFLILHILSFWPLAVL